MLSQPAILNIENSFCCPEQLHISSPNHFVLCYIRLWSHTCQFLGRVHSGTIVHIGHRAALPTTALFFSLTASIAEWQEIAKFYMDWIESLKVLSGWVSLLDFSGSVLVCYNYRKATER